MSGAISRQVAETLSDLLDGVSGPVFVVDPSERTVEELVDVVGDLDEPPEIRVLAAAATLKDVMEDFLVASRAADLIDAGVLSIRTSALDPGNEVIVTGDGLAALVSAGQEVAALSTDSKSFVEAAYDHYADEWEDAEEFTFRTPPLSRVTSSLREEISPDIEADFEAVLDSLETARGDGEGLDEVTISLLVAAKNEELLYDISKWGEDVGIASKATFSRTKTRLEELGLIDTEKVPIDVGRPRLRLKFANERLEDADADQLASVAQSLLA